MNDYYEEDYHEFMERIKKETSEINSIHERLKKILKEQEERRKSKNKQSS